MSDDERNAFARAADVVDREWLADQYRNKRFVNSVEACGPGLFIVHETEDRPTTTFTDMVEQYGWYLASYDSRDGRDRLIIMPLPEVQQR